MESDAALSTKKVVRAAWLLCFLVAGIPFWLIPYSKVTVPNSFPGVGVVAVFALAVGLVVAGAGATVGWLASRLAGSKSTP